MKKNKIIYLMVSVGLILCFLVIKDVVVALEATKVESNYNNYQVSKFITTIQFKDGKNEEQVKLSDTVELQYKWSVTEQKKGDKIVYKIPEEMYIVNDLTFDLLDTKGKKLGVVELDSQLNQLEIILEDPANLLEKESELSGMFYFTVKLSPEFWQDKIQHAISFPMGATNKVLTIDVIAENQPSDSELLYGWGIYNKKEHQVNWVLRVNHADYLLKEAEISIQVGKNSKIIPASFVISEMKNNQMVEVDKTFELKEDDGNTILSMSDVETEYLISFTEKNTAKDAALIGVLYNQKELLANTGEITAFYTTGKSIVNQ